MGSGKHEDREEQRRQMAKIKVKDLARKMGLPDQDLLFKLKSIGLRLDSVETEIDASLLQSALEGRNVTQPREVILRDEEAKAAAPAPRRRPIRPSRPGPARPPRRRPLIQKVEPRIRTIPVTERPAPAPPSVPPSAPAAAPQPAASAPGAPPPAATSPAAPPRRDKRPQPGTARPGRGERRKARRGAGSSIELPEIPDAPVTVTEGMTVREFAEKLGLKGKDLIKLLMERGQMVTVNHLLDPASAIEIAEGLGAQAMTVTFEEEVQLRQELTGDDAGVEKVARAPVVTIMGHVDHGKTTLLDTIRSSKVTAGEFGGITQHIGAYEVPVKDSKIVFLDTPGHEAFTMMRARGAAATDIVVLVVAADDGVMPQTLEAIDHAKAANVPIIVAVNKIDKANANPDRVKKELSEQGLLVEQWGGETVSVDISALNNEGVVELLEMIALTTELLELKASPALDAQGVVIEARKEPGRGMLATVLVQDGTLAVGDVFVAGATWGKVRSMTNDLGERIEKAGPSTPVEVTGLNDLPAAGDPFQVVQKESEARSVSEFRQVELRNRQLVATPGKVSLEQLFDRIQEGEAKELAVVLKADVQGSLEVLKDTLAKLSTDQVKVHVIRGGVGGITTDDVLLASASQAIIVGFNVRPERNAAELADKEEIDVRLHTVIYELVDELTKAMVGLLDPTFREVTRGRAEVREVFKVPKLGRVAGCHVVEGLVPRSARARLLRDNVVVWEGKLASLKRFKDDASEVRSGFDCGIGLDGYQDVKPGDIIEAYVQEEVAASL
ncbi:MAG: translation initiation factor IF-2 [Acidobacteriota bacterium]|nr:translation initiation factor IF-2 [Acidobacteriota bacterium]MDH3523395.1 translation initiation factor IF-2 [Acidobacteriota bacterium]